MSTLQRHQEAQREPADSQQDSQRVGSEATKQLPTDAALRAEAEFATQTNAEVAGLSPTNTAFGAKTGAISTEPTPMPTVVGPGVRPGTALTPTLAFTGAGCKGVMGMSM